MEELLPDELPIQRYYFSFTTLQSDANTERGNLLNRTLYPAINSYYEESLALLRATEKVFDKFNEADKQSEQEFMDRMLRLTRDEPPKTDEEKFMHELAQVRNMNQRREEGQLLDLEANLYLLGAIVQFLSLLESTLHTIYKKIKVIDSNNIANINDVCSRDKGIIKYLKYFEKSLYSKGDSILVGTTHYLKLYHWIQCRNNIVHNNNDITDELRNLIQQYQLNINNGHEKFLFNKDNIRELADLCGITLDKIIDSVLRDYFLTTGA